MSETQYKYVISTGTLNGIVEADSLATEIGGSSIVTALAVIETNDIEVGITFRGPLSATDQTTLTGLVTSHEGISNTKSPELVKVFEDSSTLDGARYRASTVTVDVGVGVDTVSEASVVFPLPISLYSASWIHDSNMAEDLVSITAGEDTITGALTADVAIGDTVINVQKSVIENTSVGYTLKLFDGVNQDHMGMVLSIDTVNDQVTMETATTHAFAAATPTYVQQTIYFIKDVELKGLFNYEFGEDVIGGSLLPANFPVKATYTNKEGTAKRLVILMEYKI